MTISTLQERIERRARERADTRAWEQVGSVKWVTFEIAHNKGIIETNTDIVLTALRKALSDSFYPEELKSGIEAVLRAADDNELKRQEQAEAEYD